MIFTLVPAVSLRFRLNFTGKTEQKISTRAALMQSGLDLCRSGGVILSSSERNKTHRHAPFALETACIAFLCIGNINSHLKKSLLRVLLKCAYCVPCRFGRFGRSRAGRAAYREKQKTPPGPDRQRRRGKAGHKKAARITPGGTVLFFCTGDQN